MLNKKKFKREQERIAKLVKLENWGLSPDLIDYDNFTNPLAAKTKDDIENPHIHLLRLIRNPKYLGFTAEHVFNIKLAPFQLVILNELWFRKYPMLIASRGASKSFLLSLYAMMRALIQQGTKIVVVGAAFRQAKVVFEYCEQIWNNAPVLKDIVGVGGRSGPRRDIDRCTCTVGDSIIIALPLGDGQKIRGQRANVIIADEFSTIPKTIYEDVVSGFASVSASPIEAMERAARIRVLRKLGKWSEAMEEKELRTNRGNQAIIAGTANYGFNHFADYWKEYKGIIQSKGDSNKILEVFKGKLPKKFNWKNYSILRLPAELLPEGFMDEEHIARAQITSHSSSYAVEYGAVFAMDSNGFYRRSIIEGCVVRPDNMHLMLSNVTTFFPKLKGDRDKKYVIAVDTASESDNFAIVILEVHHNHRRIVYCWTTNREKHLERIRYGTVKEKNFYAYCARKIRDLMKLFNTEIISIDMQGGGRSVLEALHDEDKLQEGEVPIWEIRSDDIRKPGENDDKPGLHIVEPVEFADAQWVSEANHGMKKDLEDKLLLFPEFDPLRLEQANQEDKRLGRIVIKNGQEIQLQDTLEDLVMEIEELKDELVSIEHTQTPTTHRDHWDTPAVKQAGGKVGRLHKDRYTALLMANMAARKMLYVNAPVKYESTGGFARDLGQNTDNNKNMPLFVGPDWFLHPKNQPLPYSAVGMAVKRGVS
jgi:predicted RNase H-related nuclease YkuK (DUF458 family)